jgi:DNA modification methylase
MPKVKVAPIGNEHSLKQQLKRKDRQRRGELVRAAAPGAAPRLLRNDVLPPLTIANIPTNELRSPERRLRKSDVAHIGEVAAAISALGFCAPVLIGKNNVIVDGETRVEAAKLLALPYVPSIRVDHLTEDEQRLLRLAVNRLGEKGQWVLEDLQIELETLIPTNVPIEVSGFTLDEIDHILIGDEAQAIEPGPLAPEQDAAAVVRLGDVFQLGPHRIICGSATDPTVLARLMEGDQDPVRLVLTDEPYNVKIAGHVTGGAHREFAMASGEMSDEEFLGFNIAWIEAALPHLCEGGVFGSFIDWRGAPIVNAAAAKLALTPLNLIVWVKTNAGMGSLYRSQHELLPLFKKGAAPHVNNVNLGKRGRWRSNVWTYPGASSLGSDARRGLQDHPTVKPTAMLQDALLDLTNRGDVVLDPFLGSGSTLIAADKTNRVCRGVELDPRYVDVIIRRYQAVTGKDSVLVETGESFAALAERRATEAARAVGDEDAGAKDDGVDDHGDSVAAADAVSSDENG